LAINKLPVDPSAVASVAVCYFQNMDNQDCSVVSYMTRNRTVTLAGYKV